VSATERAVTRTSERRAFWRWLLCSCAAVYLLQGVPALPRHLWQLSHAEDGAQQGLFDAIPVWTHAGWVAGIVVYAIALGSLERWLRRTRPAATFWASGIATVLYLLVPALGFGDWAASTPERVLGDAQVILAFQLWIWGNAWVALLMPLAVAALPGNRRHLFGRLGTRRPTADEREEDRRLDGVAEDPPNL